MKAYTFFLSALLVSGSAAGQDIYTNMTLTNQNDVIGTSRFVGMGGAMGALGADISTISSNPAGLGLYRKCDVAITAGLNFPANKKYGDYYSDNLVRGNFDQFGFVWAFRPDGNSKLKGVNIGANYQRKANYSSAFLADNGSLGNLSQMDQVAELGNAYGYNEDNGNAVNILAANAYQSFLLDEDEKGVFNQHGATSNQYAHFTTGGLMSYDFNLSFNVNNRAYFGATFGVDDVVYNRYSTYTEFRGSDAAPQDYTVFEDQRVDGTGFNLKLGTIIRPIEDNPFRFGIAFETPTWYKLKSSTLVDLSSKFDQDGNYLEKGYQNYPMPETYLEYNVRTPWKLRLSLGSTVDKVLAWGVEYEYANMKKMSQSYDNDSYGWGSGSKTTDKGMNQLTKDNMRGQHTLRLGFEVKPTDRWAFRMGYNFISSPYKDCAHYDQVSYDSYALDFTTGTQYMNPKATNILTVGLGYKYKAFYADLAYKYRYQKGDFYAFDTSYTTSDQWKEDMGSTSPELIGATIDPVEVDLSRHTLTATIGFKF